MKLCKYIVNGLKLHICKSGWASFVRYPDGHFVRIRLAKDDPGRYYVADPFLFHYNDQNWLFYETLDKTGKGIIGCLKEEKGKWIPLGIVLERPWHMSYPQVFEDRCKVYMIPEQSDKGRGNVTLYEAKNFPYEWTEVKVLINRPFADSTLLRKDGYYYLACYTAYPKLCAEVWYSDSLLGEWRRHPEWYNINQSNRLRRCGGGFIQRAGKLYRLAQDCNGRYGKRLFTVPIEISPTFFREGEMRMFQTYNTFPYGLKHTYNEICVGEKSISVVDVQRWALK